LTARRLARHLLLVFTTLLLLALAWGALAGGVRQVPTATTTGQQIETGVQIVAGVLTLLVVITCFAGHRWARPIRVAWAASLALAAALSALVWGPPMPGIALLFGVVVLLFAWCVDWMLRAARVTGAGRPAPSGSERRA
jgi:hypothetical protein